MAAVTQVRILVSACFCSYYFVLLLFLVLSICNHLRNLPFLRQPSRDRLVVRTLRCGRSNPGSNPGLGMFWGRVTFNSSTRCVPSICKTGCVFLTSSLVMNIHEKHRQPFPFTSWINQVSLFNISWHFQPFFEMPKLLLQRQNREGRATSTHHVTQWG